MSSATPVGGKSNPIDAKREEFRKYLEREGILESLTKALVQLYEEPEKPSNALQYLQNNFANNETHEVELRTLRQENEMLKKEAEELRNKNNSANEAREEELRSLKEENERLKREVEELSKVSLTQTNAPQNHSALSETHEVEDKEMEMDDKNKETEDKEMEMDDKNKETEDKEMEVEDKEMEVNKEVVEDKEVEDKEMEATKEVEATKVGEVTKEGEDKEI